jgi:hypothetical protein
MFSRAFDEARGETSASAAARAVDQTRGGSPRLGLLARTAGADGRL